VIVYTEFMQSFDTILYTAWGPHQQTTHEAAGLYYNKMVKTGQFTTMWQLMVLFPTGIASMTIYYVIQSHSQQV